jgi:hypothetical protein
MEYSTPLILSAAFTLHFVGDFIAQTRTMATNKSTSNKWLLSHVAVYSLFLLPFGIGFALLNGILHFATDYVSSRQTSKAWAEKKTHKFFAIIGADQLVHSLCLVWTLALFGII